MAEQERTEPVRRPGKQELDRLLAERGDHLLHAAIALAGSRQDGEDLLQAALERLVRRWRRIESDPEGYLRRILYNLAADGWRRRANWRRRIPLLQAGQPAHTGTLAVETVDLRDALGRALTQLPPLQRAVLILRYWEELTQSETAEILGCPEGTVKSATSRGLLRLRELTAPWHDPQPELMEETS